MKTIKIGLIILVISLLAGGCASSRSGQVYSRDHARKSHTVQIGIVETVKRVRIEGTRTGIGAAAGGATGGVLGRSVGKGTGKDVATVLGAVAGGMAGASAEEKITQKDGLEITVKLDYGEVIAIVQEADEDFAVGDRVRVLTGPGGTTRVRH